MYVAFLRGINIGSNNKINMAELKQLFESIEMTQVKTFLNSGNVVFESDIKDIIRLESKIETAINEGFNLKIEVIVRDSTQMSSIIQDYPFSNLDQKNRYITLFKSPLDINQHKILNHCIKEAKLKEDLYEIDGSHLYLYVPLGYGKTKLNNTFVEKKSGSIATTRNLNTMIKLEAWMTQ